MTTIDSFKAALIGGGARPNQFRVDLLFPSFVNGGTLAGQASQFMVNTASLPRSNIEKITANFRGRELPLAAERKFEPWNIEVYNDTNFAIRNALMSWSNQVNNIKTNGGIYTPVAYTADLLVTQLDRNGAEIYKAKIVGAWPSSVGEIKLNFSQSEVETFGVTFELLYWQDDAEVGGA